MSEYGPGLKGGVSTGGNTAGTTGMVGGQLVFAGGANITLSASRSGGRETVSIIAGTAAAAPVNFSAGTTSNNLGTVVFSNSNGVSFGLNGSTITASAVGGAGGGIALAAGTQTATTNTVLFANSNGLTFGMSDSTRITGSYTVPSVAGLISNINVSAGTTSNNLSNLVYADGNNVSFGLNGSTLTGSVASSLTNVRVSAGTTSNLLSALTLANSNGVSFGLDAGTITAQHNALTSQSNQAASASNGSFTFQTLGFSNANNVTFGTSAGSIVTASVAAGAGLTLSAFDPHPFGTFASNSGITANRLYFVPFYVPNYVYASRINIFPQVAISISAENSTGNARAWCGYGLYTQGTSDSTGQIELLTSYAMTWLSISMSSNSQLVATWAEGLSNATSHSTNTTGITDANASTFAMTNLGGGRALAFPVGLTLTPGRYWYAFMASSARAGGVVLATCNNYGLSAAQPVAAFRPFNVASTNYGYYQANLGWGTHSNAGVGGFSSPVALTTDDIGANSNATYFRFNFSGYAPGTNII